MPDERDLAAPSARRPLTSRDSGFARGLSAALLRTSVTPNQISLASIGFAILGAGAMVQGPLQPMLYLAAAVCIQLRLLCNLLDGMVAVEGGRASKLGSLYNEFPDRIADSVLIVALGYAISAPWLGWAGALAAALTAYIRVFGGSVGLQQDFRGPMAKPHRMAVLTLACVAAAAESSFNGTQWSLQAAAWIILLGSLLTCMTRTRAIAAELESA
jgi:phosphatidylglycerophosphate synthase